MSSPIINQMPFIRATREFPEDLNLLTQEVNQAYLDTAQAVNDRTIGIYPLNKRAITGNSYFLSGKAKQQSFRQVYRFTGAGNILHGINILGIEGMSPFCYGTYKDAANNWYGVIYATSVPIAGQVSFYITPNTSSAVLDGNIVVIVDAGAPAVVSGIIVLEWIAIAGNAQ
jgi:hypothetical protein